MTETSTVQLTYQEAKSQKPSFGLGPWCNQSRKIKLPILVEHLESENISELMSFRSRAYEKVLDRLSKFLNEVHGIKKSNIFWEIILFRFLNFYVDEMFVRYLFLQESFNKKKNLQFLILNREDFCTYDTDKDLLEMYGESDIFNLQLFSQICLSLGLPVKTFGLDDFGATFSKSSEHKRFKKIRSYFANVKDYFRELKDGEYRFGQNDIAKLSVDFPIGFYKQINKDEKFHLVPYSLRWPIKSKSLPDKSLRFRLSVKDDMNSFEKCLIESLVTNLPSDYLENFASLYKFVRKQVVKSRPNYILASYIPRLIDRIWVAECKELGSRLIISQHGSVYGESLRPFWQESEMRISDEYLSWGWKNDGFGDSVIKPLPAPRLMKVHRSESTKKEILLFVLRMNHLYPDLTYSFNFNSQSSQIKFIESLSESIKSSTEVRVRLNNFAPNHFQLNHLTRLPLIVIDRGERSVFEQFDRSKLVVVDHIFSTTFAECVGAGIPVIAFSEDQDDWIRPSAKKYFEDLKKVGIIYFNASEAAVAVNNIYDNIESWWHEPSRQVALLAFRNRYALTSKDGLDEWKIYLRSLTNNDY